MQKDHVIPCPGLSHCTWYLFLLFLCTSFKHYTAVIKLLGGKSHTDIELSCRWVWVRCTDRLKRETSWSEWEPTGKLIAPWHATKSWTAAQDAAWLSSSQSPVLRCHHDFPLERMNYTEMFVMCLLGANLLLSGVLSCYSCKRLADVMVLASTTASDMRWHSGFVVSSWKKGARASYFSDAQRYSKQRGYYTSYNGDFARLVSDDDYVFEHKEQTKFFSVSELQQRGTFSAGN